MNSKAQKPGLSPVGHLRYPRTGMYLLLGLLLWCSGCGSYVTSGPPPGPPVDVDLTLALAVTDEDGNPLEALVTVIVSTYEDVHIDPTLYEWHTTTSPELRTVGCVWDDADGEQEWEFNGFWPDFQTISVQQGHYWDIEVTVTKTGYYREEYNRTVFYEFVRDSGCYGMWWIVRMEEVTPWQAATAEQAVPELSR